MLPIKRKNEYLRYVMITEPYDRWSGMVYVYMEDNNIKNWKEGFDFIVEYSDGPSEAAYDMVKYGLAKPEWAKEVIKNATTGDPPLVAYLMVKDGHAKPEWAKEVIKNATSGDPSWVAYHMVRDGHATLEWLEEIERKFNAPR